MGEFNKLQDKIQFTAIYILQGKYIVRNWHLKLIFGQINLLIYHSTQVSGVNVPMII